MSANRAIAVFNVDPAFKDAGKSPQGSEAYWNLSYADADAMTIPFLFVGRRNTRNSVH